jgi:hypothetical protein
VKEGGIAMRATAVGRKESGAHFETPEQYAGYEVRDPLDQRIGTGGTTDVRALGRPPGGQAPVLGAEDEAGVSSFFPGVARVTILGPSCFSVLRPVSPPL